MSVTPETAERAETAFVPEAKDEERRSYASVWSELSEIDCSDHTEVKNMGSFKLTYLSWAWAWKILMTKYPNAHVLWMDPSRENGERGVVYGPDGTAMVHCRVIIPVSPSATSFDLKHDLSREMWLPVMDGRNNAIANPNSRHISDAKMRCLVKTLALFGLGHYIYAGEDIPHDPAQEKAVEQAIASLKAHSRTIMEHLKPMGVGLDPEFVRQSKDAIGSRDLQKIKKMVAVAKQKIVDIREAQANADTDNMGVEASTDEE